LNERFIPTNITTGMLNDITELREVVTKMERRWKINFTGSGYYLKDGPVQGLPINGTPVAEFEHPNALYFSQIRKPKLVIPASY